MLLVLVPAGLGIIAGHARVHLPLIGQCHAVISVRLGADISVSSDFCSGNIELIDVDDYTVRLRIVPEPLTELEKTRHMQWFAFRSTFRPGAEELELETTDTVVTYKIDNAGLCSYPSAWDGAEVCVSHDRQNWRRITSTRYDAAHGTLNWEWRHTASEPAAFFSYFDMYPHQRQLDFVAQCAATVAPGLKVTSLGQSLDGRELDVVSVGRGPLQAWVVRHTLVASHCPHPLHP